eukprot:scaffold44890_cov73-Attheya_sp.AAC.6
MGFLHLDNIVEAAEQVVNCATTSITMASPLPSSTPPTTELAEMAASNAAVAGATSNVAVVAGATSNVAVVAGATSNVAVAASATSVVTVIGGTGVVVGATVLMHTVLSPVYMVRNMNKPTPIPSPSPTIIPKVQCPDAGATMFAGYKVSNTSEDRQLLLMVTLTDLPERLELFLTNSFSLPTMSEEFAGNKMGSVKVRTNFILISKERCKTPVIPKEVKRNL